MSLTTDTKAVPVVAPVFTRSGEVRNPAHPPVSAAAAVTAMVTTETDHHHRQSQPRRRRGWVWISEARRIAHIARCENLCGFCREYRGGERTVNAECSACGWTGDLPVQYTPDGVDELRCPVCLASTYMRTED